MRVLSASHHKADADADSDAADTQWVTVEAISMEMGMIEFVSNGVIRFIDLVYGKRIITERTLVTQVHLWIGSVPFLTVAGLHIQQDRAVFIEKLFAQLLIHFQQQVKDHGIKVSL